MKLMRILSAGTLVAAVVGSQAVRAEGWSLLPPFSGSSSDSKSKKPAPTVKKEPAAGNKAPADKAGAGTKSFFSGVSNALTLKKPEAKKPAAKSGWSSSASGYSSSTAKSKPSSQSSWWNPFHKEEPKPRQQTLSDFVGMKRPE